MAISTRCFVSSFLCYCSNTGTSSAQIGAEGRWKAVQVAWGCRGASIPGGITAGCPEQLPCCVWGTLEVLCSLSSSMTLWKAWKGFKSNKSPERQRGSNWLLFRMYFCVCSQPSLLKKQHHSSLHCCPSVSVFATHTSAITNISGLQSE